MARSLGTDPLLVIGDRARHLAVMTQGEAPQGSLSGLYYTVHVPRSENPSKLGINLKPGEVPAQISVLFDQPDGQALVEVLATAGASVYPVEATASVDGGEPRTTIGQTGTTLALSVGWGLGGSNAVPTRDQR